MKRFILEIIRFLHFRFFLYFLLWAYCFRGWSNINRRVFDVISCLNNNLITYFVWYLHKEKRYTIETFSVDRILNKEHFYEEIKQKMCTRNQIKSVSLCKPIYNIINYSNFNCHFVSANFGKEGKKLQIFKYLKNEKSFLDEVLLKGYRLVQK